MDKVPHLTIQATPTFRRRNLTAIADDHRIKPKLIIQDHTPDCLFFNQMIQFTKLINRGYLTHCQHSHIKGEVTPKTHLFTGKIGCSSNLLFLGLLMLAREIKPTP
jgi:hypothetical protein